MTKEIEGKKQRLEFLKEEFDKEYKKRGNRAMISVAMVVLLIKYSDLFLCLFCNTCL